jgi:uncharacterized protein YdaU (DUF1376 family)
MALETSPAFQFYVKDWRSSRAVQRMSFAQRGMYLELLLEQWERVVLPDDPDVIADLIGGSAAEWRRAWPVLRRNFVTIEGGMQNLRLEEARARQQRFREQQSERGKLGAKQRWKDGTAIAPPRRRQAGPHSSSSSLAFASSSASSSALASASAPASAKDTDTALRAREDFDTFWAVYPNKTGKGIAWAKWQQKKPPLVDVLEALKWQVVSIDWLKESGRFVPNPATYLHQGRWMDQPRAPASKVSDNTLHNMAAGQELERLVLGEVVDGTKRHH